MEDIDTLEELASKRTDKQIEIDKMRKSLKSIAREMQKYQESNHQLETSSCGSPDPSEGEKVLAELVKCKTKIKCKKHRIQRLRKNLETACFVVKTIASAKDEESGSLKHDLDYAQSECAELKEKDRTNSQIINNLSKDNKTLRNKLNRVVNFIRLGYKELQKMRQEVSGETSVLAQLRKLIESCGEYYADYCNVRDKCFQLKQRNSFLQNKICFLEKNIKALSEELTILKGLGLKKENELVKMAAKSKKNNDNNVEVAFAEVKMKTRDKRNSYINNDSAQEIKYGRKRLGEFTKLNAVHDLDLSPHLSIVQKLLSDQDMLLKDLKMLSQEFLITNAGDKCS